MPTPTVSVETYSLAGPLEAFRAAVAKSARFQLWGTTWTEAQALTHIIYNEVDENDTDHALPRAIVRFAAEEDVERFSISGFDVAGQILFELQSDQPITDYPPPNQNIQDQFLTFANDAGVIRQEILKEIRDDTTGTLLGQLTGMTCLGLGRIDYRGTEVWTAVFMIMHTGEIDV